MRNCNRNNTRNKERASVLIDKNKSHSVQCNQGHTHFNGVSVDPLEETWSKMPTGSTDFANVSQVVPSLELSYQIAEKGTPWHSRLSLKAARSEWAIKSLRTVIETLSDFARRFTDDPDLRRRIDEDFKKNKK